MGPLPLLLATLLHAASQVLGVGAVSVHTHTPLGGHLLGNSRPGAMHSLQHDAAGQPELFKDDRIAVVLYAPALYSRQLKCEAAIESLRSLGRWGGRIYLITEHVKCYQHERWTQCGLDADIVVLNDPLKTKAARKWMLYGGSPWELVKDRLIRAELFEILEPPTSVQAFMYMHGCDTLVGAPLQPFMQLALEQLQHTADRMEAEGLLQGHGAAGSSAASEPDARMDMRPHLTMPHGRMAAESQPHAADAGMISDEAGAANALPMTADSDTQQAAQEEDRKRSEKGDKKSEKKGEKGEEEEEVVVSPGPQLIVAMPPLGRTDPKWSAAKVVGKQVNSMEWGSDVWVVHRTASEPLLKAWTREVLLTPDAQAGPLLRAAAHHLNRKCGHGDACVAPLLAVHSDWSQQLQCDGDAGCTAQLPAMFNYLPASVCLSFDNAAVSDWVEMLDLCTYQQLGYCPPLLMTPFAMAWLPYPTCSKLELGLSKLACQWSCTETTFFRTPSFRTTVTQRTLPVPFEGMRI